MTVPYYHRSVDFDALVREYPPSREYAETVFLHDPDKKVPHRIVHEGTKQRYLTGAHIHQPPATRRQ